MICDQLNEHLKTDSSAEARSPVSYLMGMLSDTGWWLINPYWQQCQSLLFLHGVYFRVCSAVRVRFRQDLVMFTYYTYTHAEFILTYTGLWSLNLELENVSQPNSVKSGDGMVTGLIFSYSAELLPVICTDVQPLSGCTVNLRMCSQRIWTDHWAMNHVNGVAVTPLWMCTVTAADLKCSLSAVAEAETV